MGSNCAELFDGSGQLKPSAERHSGAVFVAGQPVLAAGAFLSSDDSKMNGFDWRRMCQAFALMIAGLFTTVAAAQEPEGTHTIPFLPLASDELGRLGVARVINHSAEAGEVRIDAFDDNTVPGEGARRRLAYGPILSMKELAEEPSLRATGTVVEVNHPTRGAYLTVGNPIKLSSSPSEVERSPLLGEHTSEIMRDVLGFSGEEIEAARRDDAIGSEDSEQQAAA